MGWIYSACPLPFFSNHPFSFVESKPNVFSLTFQESLSPLKVLFLGVIPSSNPLAGENCLLSPLFFLIPALKCSGISSQHDQNSLWKQALPSGFVSKCKLGQGAAKGKGQQAEPSQIPEPWSVGSPGWEIPAASRSFRCVPFWLFHRFDPTEQSWGFRSSWMLP